MIVLARVMTEAPASKPAALAATETRMHITVSPEFVALLKKAKAGQSHVQPGATDEQVLTSALESGSSAGGLRRRPHGSVHEESTHRRGPGGGRAAC